MNENISLLESYKSYQEFFQNHASQLKADISLIKSNVNDSDSLIKVS